PVFDALAPAEAAAQHTLQFLFNPERAARLVEFHALNTENPALQEVLESILAATWKTPHGEGSGGQIANVVDMVALYDLMALAANDHAADEVRAIARLELDELHGWLNAPRAGRQPISDPAHHHSVNISGGHRQPATDCSDLRIRFDDRDAMVRSEERTLTKHEAAVLQVHPHSNGGVQVVGWDQETYAVTACKAASGSGAEAEQILSQIKMSIENGKVSTSGPGDDEEWTVYLLIRAPKSASIDMDTMNGPISLYDVDGKLTAHAKNGPISLKNFSGDAEITAVNGPISLDGGRVSVRIRTENGRVSVDLQGETWSGDGLSADAK